METKLLGFRQEIIHHSGCFAVAGDLQMFDTRTTGLHAGLHTLHYASGGIEGMQMVQAVDRNWYVPFPGEHYARLMDSGHTTGVLAEGETFSQDQFQRGLRGVGRANVRQLKPDCPMYLRPWLGEGSCELGVGSSAGPLLIIISRDKDPYLGNQVHTGVTIWAPGPAVFCRADPRCGFPMAKSPLNYGVGYKWKKRAGQLGAVEVLQYGLDGLIKETTGIIRKSTGGDKF